MNRAHLAWPQIGQDKIARAGAFEDVSGGIHHLWPIPKNGRAAEPGFSPSRRAAAK